MKLPREVKIRIRPDGKVEVETHGFVGESCLKVSDVIEKALAGGGPDADDRIERELKPEYYQVEQEAHLDAEERPT